MNGTKLTALGIAAGMGIAGISQAYAYPEFEPRGRLHIDAGFHDEDNVDMDDGFLNRRARMGLGGDLDELWDFRIEVDFSEEGVSASDFRLRRSLDVGRITLGQTKVPMGLNQLTSSNSMTFIERASPQNIVPDSRRMGVFYDVSEGMFTFQSAVYGRAIGDNEDGDMPLGVAGRFVLSPTVAENQILHLGVSVAYEDFDTDSDYNTLSFSDRPESRPAGVRLINTGGIDVESTTKYGLELAYIAGPFSAEAEYVNVDVDRDNGNDVGFDGYHAQVSYVLTGESRSYGSGGFGGITPQGNGGAWEVAARYSHMDLNDEDIRGGEQDSVTLGLNYYHSSNLRFMGNLIFTDVKDSEAADMVAAGVTDDSPTTFLARMQYAF